MPPLPAAWPVLVDSWAIPISAVPHRSNIPFKRRRHKPIPCPPLQNVRSLVRRAPSLHTRHIHPEHLESMLSLSLSLSLSLPARIHFWTRKPVLSHNPMSPQRLPVPNERPSHAPQASSVHPSPRLPVHCPLPTCPSQSSKHRVSKNMAVPIPIFPKT
ncbi:hypothetical protein LX36DRAFT_174776 [Colletotrichum falcatum]|nr:hypothetical protein LX36DRAFT_174776 [Colletotrichum falcatum]